MFTKLNSWKLTRTLLAAALTASLLSTGMAFAWPPGGNGKGGGKPPKDDPPPELPPVRYHITIPEQPPPDATFGLFISDMNNLGQVVGYYPVEDGTQRKAFLYDPEVNANEVFDLNAIVTAGVPDGWRLRWALAINDWMVVVGNIELPGSDPLQMRPVAVDLAADNPVVDLLPDLSVDFSSYASQINENGDILGRYQTPNGNWEGWIFNPGLYGDPSLREPPDGTPLDMSDWDPDQFPLPLPANARSFHLNNPVGNRPAQIAGHDANSVAYLYTLGEAELELFPEMNLDNSFGVTALNDSEIFCGLLYHPKGGKGAQYAPYRYTTERDLLPGFKERPESGSVDMNSSDDLIVNDRLYRDDWGDRYVNIDDLVVGTDADLFSGNLVTMSVMNDRPGPSESDSGQIAGNLWLGGPPTFFFLDPVPVTEP